MDMLVLVGLLLIVYLNNAISIFVLSDVRIFLRTKKCYLGLRGKAVNTRLQPCWQSGYIYKTQPYRMECLLDNLVRLAAVSLV